MYTTEKRLTISSWNVQGLFKRNDNESVSKLNDEELLSQLNSDIACLFETKADKEEEMYSLKVIAYLRMLLGLGSMNIEKADNNE